MAAAACSADCFARFMRDHKWLLYVSIAVNLVAYYVMVYVRAASREIPANYILLLIHTLTQGYSVSYMATLYDPASVFMAVVLTAVTAVALTAYAYTTKRDFTVRRGLLFVIVGVSCAAVLFLTFCYDKWVRVGVFAAAAVILSVYLVYDMQLILGKYECKLTVNDHVFTAMLFYLDVGLMFVEVVKLIRQCCG